MNSRTIAKVALGGLIMVISTTALISQTQSNPPVIRPRVTVDFENEILTLAKGFELAFKALPSGGKYVEVSTPDGSKFLDGSVRSMKAVEGVLVVTMEQGLVYAISARDIVLLTNEKPAYFNN